MIPAAVLRHEVLRRLESLGRPVSASVVAHHGEALNVTRVWTVLSELWEAELVEGFPEGPWRLVGERVRGAVTHGQMRLGEG